MVIRLKPLLLAGCALLDPLLSVRVSAVTFNWNGQIDPANVTSNSNWAGGVAPLGLGADDVVFGNITSGPEAASPTHTVQIPAFPGAFGVDHITFNGGGARPAYTFAGTGMPSLILNGNLTASTGANVLFNSTLNVKLTSGGHTVDVSGTEVTVASDVSNYTTSSNITKNGNGVLKLTGNNTFTGGITVNAGDLYLGHSNAAGTGTLTMKNNTSLFHFNGSLIAPNAVVLNSGTVTVNSVLGSDSLTLNGNISGSALLALYGNGGLTLAGNNASWSGGITLFGNGTININNSNALGTGALIFDATSDATVNFNVSTTINGLAGASDPSTIYLYSGSVLTINQAGSSTYAGYINDGGSPGGITKTGSGALTLTNANSYTGPTVVNGGSLVANGATSTTGQLGFGAATVNSGGTVIVQNTSLSNSTVTVNSGGRLVGQGSVNSVTTINSGGILAPGFSTAALIGSIGFNDLTLKGGGFLEWNLSDPTGSAGTGFDSVTLLSAPLRIDASTLVTPFNLRLISLNAGGSPGTATGFLMQTYTWTLFDASSSSITGFSVPAQFSIDSTAFTTDVGPGNFFVSQNGNLLQLTFTPVPEPSTWALILGGVGAMFAYSHRRRRAYRNGAV